jgi:GNAT superfamily N-acetyltransferase
MDVLLRKGEPEDVAAVLDLVRELALFERQPQEVTVTEREMQRWGFGPEKVFDFYVIEKQGAIIGTAIYYFKYSTWKGRCIFLEDIIVTERERGKGYGTMLFSEIVKLSKLHGARRLEWQVLNWNESAIAFYRKWNAGFDGEWLNCRIKNEL